ncbi:MAG: host attachment protein [Burkholderiales bacterium]|nr:MAG: host attachment protein [Burkholderiales bacterium]
MAKIWILLADSGAARLLQTEDAGATLSELQAWADPDARLPAREREADGPGRSFDSKGMGRHAMEPDTDPKTREAQKFARLLAEQLHQGRVNHGVQRMALVAPPAFLGQLRAAIDAQTRQLVRCELDKDLVKSDERALRQYLPAELFSTLG